MNYYFDPPPLRWLLKQHERHWTRISKRSVLLIQQQPEKQLHRTRDKKVYYILFSLYKQVIDGRSSTCSSISTLLLPSWFSVIFVQCHFAPYSSTGETLTEIDVYLYPGWQTCPMSTLFLIYHRVCHLWFLCILFPRKIANWTKKPFSYDRGSWKTIDRSQRAASYFHSTLFFPLPRPSFSFLSSLRLSFIFFYEKEHDERTCLWLHYTSEDRD